MTVYRTQSLLYSIRLGALWMILLKEKLISQNSKINIQEKHIRHGLR